jgi:hypothetical protein
MDRAGDRATDDDLIGHGRSFPFAGALSVDLSPPASASRRLAQIVADLPHLAHTQPDSPRFSRPTQLPRRDAS